MANSSVLVVGSANLDLVFSCERFPMPGETLLGGEFATHPGGKGANQAVAAGRLGGDVYFCGCIGSDANGGVLRQSLESSGVKTRHLHVSSNRPSGTACILVDAQGSNEIVVAPGSNFEVSADHVRDAIQMVKPTVVIAQLEVPLDAVHAASEADFFILNPAPAQALPDKLAAACAIITPNESELVTLTGASNFEEGAKILLDRGANNVIVTLGDKGCLWVSKEGSQFFEANRVEAVDTTAAGDAFNGALAHFLAEGLSISEAIPQAGAVAALSVTRHGAQQSMPSMAELRDFQGRA